MNQTPLPVTVISGFTGAAKSALLDRLLANDDGKRIGVIGFGSPEVPDEARDLPNGCRRVTLPDHSIEAIEQAIVALADERRFDAIAIEAPAMLDPMAIAEQLAFGDDDDATLAGRARLDTFVTVIDAPHFLRDYASTETLEGGGDGKTIVEALVEQIEFCDVVIIDESDDTQKISRMIRAMNPRAHQLVAANGDVPLDDVLDTGRFDFDTTASAPGWLAILNDETPAPEDDAASEIGHLVYRARRPFHPERLWNLLHQEWPGVLRAKGFFWLATRGEVGGSLSQAGGTLRHGPAGVWWAAQDRSEWPTDDPELEAEIVAEWFGDADDNSVGDRRQKLVLIGENLDADAWQSRFDACLLDR
ncbi:putative metal chaperone, involved in Zn homeostasis, GTPase [Candidatus Burkholderia verschuerenii]|uniref:Putative metal chaperone, involved in Zn homeostasis, GTPase n=1 Tax=Candidatus Burkholderia verschuerenii TaxID=242163 RepID=A0A0L0MHN9_9BURK|nr:putative metal chaperone, involved in Zn homeostasis, GTPase [Candidatus Burkholderia verschuerenii]